MIDIHTHMLPGVDDGASDIQMSIQLILDAVRNGTKEIFLTPHCAPSYGFYNYDGEDLAQHFNYLCQVVYEQERIPVMLHPGMEVLYESREEMLRLSNDYFPLCGSRYLLMEYYFDVDEFHFLEGIETAQECGYVPVVAHPERYECVQNNRQMIQEGREKGAYFQINKGSLGGRHGEDAQRTGEWMLHEDLADFIASDAHHPKQRGSNLRYVEEYVRFYYGEERARRIFMENPECIIHNRRIHRSKDHVKQAG